MLRHDLFCLQCFVLVLWSDNLPASESDGFPHTAFLEMSVLGTGMRLYFEKPEGKCFISLLLGQQADRWNYLDLSSLYGYYDVIVLVRDGPTNYEYGFMPYRLFLNSGLVEYQLLFVFFDLNFFKDQ